MSKPWTTKQFIKKANKIHNNNNNNNNNKYDYSNAIYYNSKKKIEIVCLRHCSFMQTPNSRILGVLEVCFEQSLGY